MEENDIKELFKIYIEKTNNDLIKAEILNILNNIFTKDVIDIKLDGSIMETQNPLLNLLDSTSQQQIQTKILILFKTLYKKFQNALKNSTQVIVDELLKIKTKEDVLLYHFLSIVFHSIQ